MLEPDPSHATWRRRLDWIPNGPTHLQQRLCRDGAPERERLLAAMHRAVVGDELLGANDRFHFVIPGCDSEAERASLCDWLRRSVRAEPPGPVRVFLLWKLFSCATLEDAQLFTAPNAPDEAVVAFLRKHRPDAYSTRLEAVVRRRVQAGEWKAARTAALAYGSRDDPRVAATLLELYAAARDPGLRHGLGLALQHQTDPKAFEVYASEWRVACERGRAAAAEHKRTGGSLHRHGLGYVIEPSSCDIDQLRPVPVPAPPQPRTALAGTLGAGPHLERHREALRCYGLEDGLLSVSLDGAGPLGSHAPLLRRMADFVRPELDALVLEEVWPALDDFRFERGPRDAWVFVERGGYHVRVGDLDGEADPEEIGVVEEELGAALDEPHFVDAWLDGQRFHFGIRALGRVYDVEALVGAMNTLLRARGSDLRFAVLEPSVPFAVVDLVVGPSTRLLDAVNAGAIAPGAPFAAARRGPDFSGRIPEARD
jgi:hypothetical protein